MRATFAAAALTTLAPAALAAPAHAAPSPVATATAAAPGDSVTVVRPVGLVAGDVVVAAITARAAATAAIAAPIGWTEVRRDSCAGPGGVQLTQALYIRVASPSEPPSSAWRLTAATGVAAGVAAYRGVDGATPVQSSAGDSSRNSHGIHAPSVANAAGSLVTAFYGRSAAGGVETPAGTTNRYAASTASAAVLAVDAVRASAGSTGTLVARPSTPVTCNIGQTLVLRTGSAAAPTPPPPPSGDRTAPTAPGSVRASGATQTSVVVAWNASTDNVGVAGYGLYRDGAATGTATGTSTTFTGLTCGRSYAFGVDAFDAAGNRSSRSTVTASTSACPPQPPPPPPPPPPTGTRNVVLVDRQFDCNTRVDLDLVKVTMRTANADAISLGSGCSGRIGRVEVQTWTQDGIKVQNQVNPARDLVIGGGYVKGWALSSGAHQDGIQAMGGSNITFRNLTIDVVGAQNLFINRAGGGATTPTDIVCESCVLGPNVATPLLVNVTVRSGARNTLVCTASRFGRSVSYSGESQNPVNAGNAVLPLGDPRCSNITGT